MLNKFVNYKSIETIVKQKHNWLTALFNYNKSVLNINYRCITNSKGLPKHNPFAENVSNRNSFTENTTTTSHQHIDEDKMRKIFRLEMDVSRQEGRRIPDPDNFREEQWKYLLTLKSRSARTKYYAYLWQIERKNENKQLRKIKSMENLEIRRAVERKETEENDHIIYGLSRTSFFLRLYDSTINHWQNNKLVQAMQFSENLILDCSYDVHMNKREEINTAKQLMLTFAENRMHDEPFNLHYCNVNKKSVTMGSLGRHIPTLYDPEFPLNVHEECFTKLFPKENLVYLTPHCKTDLETFNHNDTYIIGAMVDKVNNEPLSLGKAKKLGLRMARLPLDKYLSWGSGSGKSLTINQMVNILLDLKKSGDWNYGLRHVPKRKLYNLENERKEQTRIIRKRTENYKFNLETWGSPKKHFSR